MWLRVSFLFILRPELFVGRHVRTGAASRASAVKVTTTVSFPQGTDSDLADIESWLTEFDRVAAHIASGEMMAKDKCTNLVSSWVKTTVAGKCLRSVQKSNGYKLLEASGQYQQAYDVLLVCLRSLAIPKKVRRRQLEFELFALAARADANHAEEEEKADGRFGILWLALAQAHGGDKEERRVDDGDAEAERPQRRGAPRDEEDEGDVYDDAADKGEGGGGVAALATHFCWAWRGDNIFFASSWCRCSNL